MTAEHATVKTADQVSISITLHRREGRRSAVIVCPGFFQSKETRTFQRLAETLAGIANVIAMDFRGHGRSSGLYAFSAKEGADFEAALVWAESRYSSLGILGFSMGGAIAINALAKRRGHVRSLATVSAPTAFEDIEFKWWTPEALRTGLNGLEPGAGCRPGSPWLHKGRPIHTIAHLAPLPLLIVHGTRDMIVGVEHSRRLYAAASNPKRLTIIEGGGHAEALFRDDPERFTGLVAPWFAETL